jgi:acetoin utilization deacetylase AcuC-like enzyme
VILADPRCLDHDPASHPESPARLRAVLDALEDRGLPTETAPPASRAALTPVHDPAYLDELRAFCAAGGGRWDADTVAVPDTETVARLSAGLARAAVLGAVDGDGPTLALGRPPGHHATREDAMGFCFLNNVAVGVECALGNADAGEGRETPTGDDPPLDGAQPPAARVDRVAVVDWDVHHGNGTQDQFLDRGDVFYASVHARDLFPAGGRAAETGTGDGEGTTLNCPLPGTFGDAVLLAVYDRVVDPALRRFDPDLVVVSAGFDAHRRDPLSRATVTTDGFRALSALLDRTTRAVDAAGPALVLEGGYDPTALADCVLGVWDTPTGGVDPDPPERVPETVTGLVTTQRERFGL